MILVQQQTNVKKTFIVLKFLNQVIMKILLFVLIMNFLMSIKIPIIVSKILNLKLTHAKKNTYVKVPQTEPMMKNVLNIQFNQEIKILMDV